MKSETKKGRKKWKLCRWGGQGQHQVGEGMGRRRGPPGEGMKEEEEWKLRYKSGHKRHRQEGPGSCESN